MERCEAQSIGDIIKQVIKEQNLEDRMLEQRIIDMWPKVVGSAINKYTVNRYIDNHVLYVYITSAPLKNELVLYKSRLLEMLNSVAGRAVITDVVIR